MENQLPINKSNNKEIDILDLFRMLFQKIEKWVKLLLRIIGILIKYIIGKYRWITAFSIVGIAIGLLLFSLTPATYDSYMVGRSNATDNNLVVDAINNLSELCKQNNEDLAKQLKTDTKNAMAIKAIGAYYGIDNNGDGQMDYVDYKNSFDPQKSPTFCRLPNVFYVKVRVLNESIYPAITKGIKSYIAKSPFIATNNLVRKEQIANMIAAYNIEIKKLDSLQKSYYYTQLNQQAGNSQMMFLSEKEVKLFHRDVLALVQEKQSMERSLLVDPEPITITEDFTALNERSNPWTKYAKLFGVSFAFLGLFFGVFWEYKKDIWRFIVDAK